MLSALEQAAPRGFDLAGAAQLLEERALRWAPLMASPAVTDVWRLLVRNTWAAPAILAALKTELGKNPDRAVTLDLPLFGQTSVTREAR